VKTSNLTLLLHDCKNITGKPHTGPRNNSKKATAHVTFGHELPQEESESAVIFLWPRLHLITPLAAMIRRDDIGPAVTPDVLTLALISKPHFYIHRICVIQLKSGLSMSFSGAASTTDVSYRAHVEGQLQRWEHNSKCHHNSRLGDLSQDISAVWRRSEPRSTWTEVRKVGRRMALLRTPTVKILRFCHQVESETTTFSWRKLLELIWILFAWNYSGYSVCILLKVSSGYGPVKETHTCLAPWFIGNFPSHSL
jgi:hypothetical protein